MAKYLDELDWWKAEVDGEEWLVEGYSVKDVIGSILMIDSEACIDQLERTDIIRVVKK